jgi:hypothetical protein
VPDQGGEASASRRAPDNGREAAAPLRVRNRGGEATAPLRIPIAPLRPVPTNEYGSPAVLAARRRERYERRLRARGRWWYAPAIAVILVCSTWGLLRFDQWVAERVIWPHAGVRFVEVAPSLDQPRGIGGRVVVVIGGLNRKSGTDIALALLPGLAGPDTRVLSLVYGSGIAERDILDKFDGLVQQVRPRVVDFYGSSMGGDIALMLAAHAQQVRDGAEAAAAADAVSAGALAGTARLGPDEVAAPIPPDTAHVGVGYPDQVAAPIPPGTAALSIPSVVTRAPSAGWPLPRRLPPLVGVVFLDCTPLGSQDVRDPGRTRADAVTGLTEALHTEGGAVVRVAAEIFAQQPQWSTGRFPFLDVRWDDLEYKIDQVMREKISDPGISTRLVKDQYGVIRRMNAEEIFAALRPGTRIVYLRPVDPDEDPVVLVDRVERSLLAFADRFGMHVTIAPVLSGHHASADSQPDQYRGALARASAAGR